MSVTLPKGLRSDLSSLLADTKEVRVKMTLFILKHNNIILLLS